LEDATSPPKFTNRLAVPRGLRGLEKFDAIRS
jgi:hypothetical protein